MKGREYIVVLAALLVGALNAQSQQQAPGKQNFTLKEAIQFGFANSMPTKNAELDMANTIQRKKEITGTGLPQISGIIDVKDYLSIPTSLLPGDFFGQPGTYVPVKFGTQYNATAGFNAQQLLFSSDYIFGLKAQRSFVELSRIGIDRSKSDVAAQVTKAYYAVLITRARVRTLEANITILKKTYEDTKAANELGLAELLDVQRLELQYVNLQTELEKATRFITVTETMLKFQMGYPSDAPIELSDSLRMDESWSPELTGGRMDISNRPELLALRQQEVMLGLDHRRAKWSYAPTLAAYGSLQWNAQRSEFNFLDFDSADPTKQWFKVGLIGVSLNWSLFTGFQRTGKVEQARIQTEKIANTIAYTEQAAQTEASVANINYVNAYSTLERQKKNMELAKSVLEVSQKKYESGIGRNVDVVIAQAGYVEAQSNFYNSIYDLVVARTDYQRATGTILK